MTLDTLVSSLIGIEKLGIQKQCLKISDIAEAYDCDMALAGKIMQEIKKRYDTIPFRTRCTVVDYARWLLSGFSEKDLQALERLSSILEGRTPA